MLILITGGSSSGKSAFAEKLAAEMKEKTRDGSGAQTDPRMVYIATMEPFSEDAKEKIKHHHELRAGKGFVTLEQYTDMEKAISRFCDPKPVVLLECLSNLLANEMFAPRITEAMRAKPEFEEEMCRKICGGIQALEEAASCLLVVSCNVSEDGASYPWETVKYIRILEQIQTRLARTASQVYEVVCGIPVALKGNSRAGFAGITGR